MSTGAMLKQMAAPSPRSVARVAGIFQALASTTATFGQVVVPGRLIVHGNAATTAANILTRERLFWLGFTSSLVGVVCHLIWALLLYELFKPVDRRVSRSAVFVMLLDCSVQVLTTVFYLAPMLILNAGSSVSAFTTEQLQALSYMFVRLSGYAFNTNLVFFGLWCVLIGYLIFHSTFMPRILGVLLAIAGFGWMLYLVPPLAMRLFIPYIAGASALGELPVMLWLLVAGVNDERWREQAGVG